MSETFAAIVHRCPITGVYVAMDNRTRGLSTALEIVEAAQKLGGIEAPVFLLSDNDDLAARPVPGAALDALQLIPFGTIEDMAAASGLLAFDTQLAEREFHATYLGLPDTSGEASGTWHALKKE